MIEIKTRGRKAAIKAPLTNTYLPLLQRLPSKKHWEGNVLVFEPTGPAIDYIRRTFPEALWDEGAQKYAQVADNLTALAIPMPTGAPLDYLHKTKPFEHQEQVFLASREETSFALLMEQGTGKTKVILDTAAYLFAKGVIRGLLVIAKNGVHTNWLRKEIPIHLPDWCPRRMAAWSAQKGEKGISDVFQVNPTSPELAILAINTEALSTKRGEKVCERFLLAYPSLVVVDESTSIKTPGAKRTKAVLRLASLSHFRRILTGTPITKSPLDAYAQFSFLDEEILGFTSFYAFRARYAVMQPLKGKLYNGRPIQIVVGYQNLPELQQKIKMHSFRVLKKECLDLPEKLYQQIPFEMSPAQWEHYIRMEEEIETSFQGRRIAAPLVMTNLLRLHQIACGFLPTETPKVNPGVAIEESNPRLEALLETIDRLDGKMIIFANFRYSLREIWKALTAKYGENSCVAYSGEVKGNDKRSEAIEQFQDEDSPVRFFIGQTDAAGYGLTLTAARTVIYYSNDYKLELRQQSEDRAHRIGQRNNVLYIDFIAKDTVDEEIINSLLDKQDIASQITGDKLLKWIERNDDKRRSSSLKARKTAYYEGQKDSWLEG